MSKILFLNFGDPGISHMAPPGTIERVDIAILSINDLAIPREITKVAKALIQEALPFLKGRREVVFGLPDLPLLAVAIISILCKLRGQLPSVIVAAHNPPRRSVYNLYEVINLQRLSEEDFKLR